MDIKNILPETTVTLELIPLKDAPEPQFITFTIGFIALDEVQDYPMDPGVGLQISKQLRKMLIDKISGWDLKENGKVIPMEDKARAFNLIAGVQTKQEGVKQGIHTTVAMRLANFAGDINNFLKN